MLVLGFRTHFVYIYTNIIYICTLPFAWYNVVYWYRKRSFLSIPRGMPNSPCRQVFLRFICFLLPASLFLKVSLSSFINRRDWSGSGRAENGVIFFVSLTNGYLQKHADNSSSPGLLWSGRRAIFCVWLLLIQKVTASFLSCISIST